MVADKFSHLTLDELHLCVYQDESEYDQRAADHINLCQICKNKLKVMTPTQQDYDNGHEYFHIVLLLENLGYPPDDSATSRSRCSLLTKFLKDNGYKAKPFLKASAEIGSKENLDYGKLKKLISQSCT